MAGLALSVSQEPARAATATLVYEEPIPGLEPEPVYAMNVEAPPGEVNALTLSQDGDGYTVRDTAAALQAGAGCDAVAADEVRCPAPRPVVAHNVFVAAGDKGDRLTIERVPQTTFVEARGGAGDDSILGGPGRDLLFGGSGADSIVAGPGGDRLDGGHGDDTLDGGTGRDRVLYDTRSVPVRVDLAAARGGAAGERDEILAVEEILGGTASDNLSGDGLPNVIIGGGGKGRDTISGRGGDDDLSGYRVAGGPGDDHVAGRLVSCGAGRDLISRGPGHWLRGPFPRACETVLAIFLTLAPDPVSRSPRRADFAIACRAPRCSGALELRDSRGRLGLARFSIRQGNDRDVLHRVRIGMTRRPAERVATLRVSGERAYQSDWLRTRLR